MSADSTIANPDNITIERQNASTNLLAEETDKPVLTRQNASINILAEKDPSAEGASTEGAPENKSIVGKFKDFFGMGGRKSKKNNKKKRGGSKNNKSNKKRRSGKKRSNKKR
jgi:hypothetical protein